MTHQVDHIFPQTSSSNDADIPNTGTLSGKVLDPKDHAESPISRLTSGFPASLSAERIR
jgi:hypothetical protein